LFSKEDMVCTKTLYNELRLGRLPLSLFEVPELLKRKQRKENSHVYKRPKQCYYTKPSSKKSTAQFILSLTWGTLYSNIKKKNEPQKVLRVKALPDGQEMLYCPVCGRFLDELSTHCPYCGQVLK